MAKPTVSQAVTARLFDPSTVPSPCPLSQPYPDRSFLVAADDLGLDRISVGGNSNAGSFAMHLALAYPDRTEANMENWGFSVGKSASVAPNAA